jgi:DNA-binding NarL/FixJ family response regulator
VTVTGADGGDRGRLVALLAGMPGIEVVGWGDSAATLVASGACPPLSVVLDAEQDRAGPPVTRMDTPRRPRLSARQREVLAAYRLGNDLLLVVARRLGMAPETVKTHLRRIRCKYEEAGRSAPTRRDLYVRAVEDGLLISPRSSRIGGSLV